MNLVQGKDRATDEEKGLVDTAGEGEGGTHCKSSIETVCECVCVLVAQSRTTLCNPMDCRPSGSSVHGVPQMRILEWVAIPFSRGSS